MNNRTIMCCIVCVFPCTSLMRKRLHTSRFEIVFHAYPATFTHRRRTTIPLPFPVSPEPCTRTFVLCGPSAPEALYAMSSSRGQPTHCSSSLLYLCCPRFVSFAGIAFSVAPQYFCLMLFSMASCCSQPVFVLSLVRRSVLSLVRRSFIFLVFRGW